jgi:nitrite reductase/ring-hydroxylating ferredoxin subunit
VTIEGDENELLCPCGDALFDPTDGALGEGDKVKCYGCGKTWNVTLAAWSCDYEAEEVVP